MVCPLCPVAAAAFAAKIAIPTAVVATAATTYYKIPLQKAALVAAIPIASALGLYYYTYQNTKYINQNCFENKNAYRTTILSKSSNVLGKDGNHIVASLDADNFFFSMCTTKKGATIESFNSSEDRIFIFCSKETIFKPKVDFNESENITHVLVNAAHGITDIKLIGNHSDVEPILNTGFIPFCNGETLYWNPEN